MPTYEFTLHSGQTVTAEDKRNLQKLSADLCSAGFLVVLRRRNGYSSESSEISILERAVASIQPVNQ